jgi:hypothetical protein
MLAFLPLAAIAGGGEPRWIQGPWPNEGALLGEVKELGISQLFSG